MKRNGFTLIELMIVVAVAAIFLAIILPIFGAGQGETASWSYLTGWTEERCMGGYKFVKGQRGSPTQVLDAQGHGIPCK